MGFFDDNLKADQTLFKNPNALTYEFLPKILPFRESQQQTIASCIKPLFNQFEGRNALVYGPPGIGKTAATRHIFRELEETTDDVVALYVNCWKKNTAYKVLVELCDLMGYKFVQNKKTDELLTTLNNLLLNKAVVFCLDEADKLEDQDLIYHLFEQFMQKSLILITNEESFINQLDYRVLSRLNLQRVAFSPYTERELYEILKQRAEYAFYPNVLSTPALVELTKRAHERNDVRKGIFLMKESGLIAEEQGQKQIQPEHVQEAVDKLLDYSKNETDDLQDSAQDILSFIKEHSDLQRIGDLFDAYQKINPEIAYKTFQRRIDKLATGNFIVTTKTKGGKDGNTTIITLPKKVSDF